MFRRTKSTLFGHINMASISVIYFIFVQKLGVEEEEFS